MIYFDNASTTKPDSSILELYNKINNEYWYNESSAHHLGIVTKTILDKAQNTIIKSLKLKNKKVIFTSSASEANNLAIYGICKQYIGQNKQIITSKIEHPSVLNCFQDLEKLGFKVVYVDVDINGQIDLEMLKNSLTKDTILISIMWVNNIIGSIQPIKKIKEIIKQYPRIKFHSDLVQGLTKLNPDFDYNDLDLITFTAHKIHGLKGTGALIINDNLNIEKITKGGHQQNNLRAGTVDVAGAYCCARSLELAMSKTNDSLQKVTALHDYLINSLKTLDFITLNHSDSASPYVINFSLKNLKGETLMHYLEQSNIYIGYGSACNAKTKQLEPTLMATYHDEVRASNSVRISLSENNTIQEIEYFIEKLKDIGSK